MNDTLIQQFIDLTIRKRETKELEKSLSEQIDEIEKVLMEEFTLSGTQRTTKRGHTVSLTRNVTPSVKGGMQQTFCDAMKGLGLGDMVKESVNYQTLGSWVRNDLDRDPDDMPILPAEVAEMLNVYEIFKLRVTKA